jgi:hypothetical protein
MKKIILLITILFLANGANGDPQVKTGSASIDLNMMESDQIHIGSSGKESDEVDVKEKFHEKIKAMLEKSRKTGVIYKDKSGRFFTNGEYKLQLNVENKNQLFSHIEYKINNSEFIKYSDPISLDTEGVYRFYYRGVDLLGNQEELKSYGITVDRREPDVIAELVGEELPSNSPSDITYYKSGVKLEVKAFDKGAGVNAVIVNINHEGNIPIEEAQTTFTKLGEYTIYVRAIDNVYNLSKKTKISFAIDDKKPTIAYEINNVVRVIDGKTFCKSNSSIVITASDLETGVAKIEYSIDEKEWKEYKGEIKVDKGINNLFQLFYRAIDNSGNYSDTGKFNCMVDYLPPRTTIITK